MLKAPLSWMIVVLLILSIYSFLYLRPRRNRHRWIRRLFRRRHRSSASRFHLFDLPPSHFVGAGLDSASVAGLPIERFAALKLLTNGRVPPDCVVWPPNRTIRHCNRLTQPRFLPFSVVFLLSLVFKPQLSLVSGDNGFAEFELHRLRERNVTFLCAENVTFLCYWNVTFLWYICTVETELKVKLLVIAAIAGGDSGPGFQALTHACLNWKMSAAT